MLHTCVQRFDVTENFEKFYKILRTKQTPASYSGPHGPPHQGHSGPTRTGDKRHNGTWNVMRLASSSWAGAARCFSAKKGAKRKTKRVGKAGGWWPSLRAPLFARFAPPGADVTRAASQPRKLVADGRPRRWPGRQLSLLPRTAAPGRKPPDRVVRCGPFCVASCPQRNCRLAYTPLDNGWVLFYLLLF